MQNLKSLGLCLAISALFSIPTFLAIQYFGGTTYRGFLNFDIFILCLIFTKLYASKSRLRFLGMGICATVAMISFVFDVQNLSKESLDFKSWFPSPAILFVTGLFLLLCSIPLLSKTKSIKTDICLFSILGLFIINNITAAINSNSPILESPIFQKVKYSNEGSFKRPDRETLLNTSDFNLSLLDTTKNTVIILVESFGIPVDTIQKQKFFRAFNSYPGKIAGTKKRPIHNTIYAEREEYIPALNLFNQAHYELIYAYGGPSSLYNRKGLFQEFGFTQIIFGDSLNDKSMAAKIDSLLGEDSKNKKFIAWTTTDTKFPIKSLSLYSKKLETTEDLIVQLAKAHTKTKFIIVGDHAPIRCNKEIRNAFYRNYVPYFILN